MDGPATILVVCNPQDAAELSRPLAEGGALPVAGVDARVLAAEGDDATVRSFAEVRPEVVVVAATLDAGDGRSLIASLRAAASPGTFHVVLVGDLHGPIRNALDAADFAADRFVARPVAPKALRYAAGASVAAARRARVAAGEAPVSAAPVAVLPDPPATRLTGTHRAVMVTERRVSSRLEAMLDAAVEETTRDEVVRRTSGGFAVPVEAILAAGGDLEEMAEPAVTAPMTVHEVPTRPVGAMEARHHAVNAAMADAPAGAVVIQPRRQTRADADGTPAPEPGARGHVIPPATPESAPAGKAAGPTDAHVTLHEESGSHELPPGLVSETEGSFDELDVVEPVARLPAAGDVDPWDAPPPVPVREPTMILSEGAPAAPMPVDLDVTERRGDGAWARPSSVAPMETDDHADDARPAPPPDEPDDHDDVEDNLDVDLGGLSVNRPLPSAPPSGGDFARELRKKMSLMAQRLFRQADVPTPPSVDVRPPHDFRTEIDLAEIDAGARPSGTEVYDLAADATFAGDDHGLASAGILGGASDPGTAAGVGAGTAPRTSESGEIVRGTSDAAVLIARMFAGEFTGKVAFRQGDVEKAIYFDDGRPVFASSDLPSDRMGELLFREGKITAEQHARCRDIVLEQGRRMGEILVDRGFLKRRELLPAVRRHVEDIIYSLFAWDAGEYRIVPGDGASGERIRLSRHPAAMVLEGVRRKIDLATLERLLGAPTTVVEVADRDKAGTVVAVADLSPDERAALAAMDGSADLGHVARTTGAPLESVYQLAWAMSLLGIGTVRRRGVDEDDAPALVGETDLAIDRERVRARHRLVAEADYFALLGVRRDATAFEIKRAYESALRDFDAESFPPELRTELALELAEIGTVLEEAYRVLRDDRLRSDYLAHLAD